METKEILLDVYNFKERQITCVPIQQKYFSSDGVFNRALSNYTYQDSCQNIAFYKSSGKTENEYIYKNVWFPFMRCTKKNWFMKCFGMITMFMNQNTNYFHSPDKMLNIKKTPEVIYFMNRFSFWWQLRISAMLAEPNSIWFMDENFFNLRELALNYESTFKGFERSEMIVYKLNNTGIEIEDINNFLEKNDALCVKTDKYESEN